MTSARPPVVVCFSLEPWDEVWRRNQHFAHQLVTQGYVGELLFVEPPRLTNRPTSFVPEAGIRVIRPWLPGAKRWGALTACGRLLRETLARRADVIWVNDSAVGAYAIRPGQRAVYDITDDWRAEQIPDRGMRRLVAAEDRLARSAATIVCSVVLQQRWKERYGVEAHVIQNAVDLAAYEDVRQVSLPGEGPHLGYVGTLHASRLDVGLTLRLAREVGSVHLVGPNALDAESARLLSECPSVYLHGAVSAVDVPAWMRAMDVLISPHAVNDFTMSLDAIKSHEYAAARRPVVATATSGFQLWPQTNVAQHHDEFVALARCPHVPDVQPISWAERTRQFADVLLAP